MLNESKVGGVVLGALEGARSATGSAPSTTAEVKRWSAGRKKQVVLRLLRGESVDALSRELAVPIYRLEAWRDRALAGIEVGLKERDQAEGRRTAARLVPSAARDAAKPHRTIRSRSNWMRPTGASANW